MAFSQDKNDIYSALVSGSIGGAVLDYNSLFPPVAPRDLALVPEGHVRTFGLDEVFIVVDGLDQIMVFGAEGVTGPDGDLMDGSWVRGPAAIGPVMSRRNAEAMLEDEREQPIKPMKSLDSFAGDLTKEKWKQVVLSLSGAALVLLAALPPLYAAENHVAPISPPLFLMGLALCLAAYKVGLKAGPLKAQIERIKHYDANLKFKKIMCKVIFRHALPAYIEDEDQLATYVMQKAAGYAPSDADRTAVAGTANGSAMAIALSS